jgi:hypothetical protein
MHHVHRHCATVRATSAIDLYQLDVRSAAVFNQLNPHRDRIANNSELRQLVV